MTNSTNIKQDASVAPITIDDDKRSKRQSSKPSLQPVEYLYIINNFYLLQWPVPFLSHYYSLILNLDASDPFLNSLYDFQLSSVLTMKIIVILLNLFRQIIGINRHNVATFVICTNLPAFL